MKTAIAVCVFMILAGCVVQRAPKYVQCKLLAGDPGEILSNVSARWQFRDGRWEVLKDGVVVATMDLNKGLECHLVTIP